jgi:hypothetical protein
MTNSDASHAAPVFVFNKTPLTVPGAFENVFRFPQDTLGMPDQPKAALFQRESGTSQSDMSSGWFVFGLYVLIALIFSGLSGYTAVGKGLNPLPYFFMGFFLNVFGYLYVLTRRSAVAPGEVPAGLVKVHTTLAPVPCAKCGNTNHPAAKKCLGCGAELEPLVQSDVGRV